jgi:hypothetical protein
MTCINIDFEIDGMALAICENAAGEIFLAIVAYGDMVATILLGLPV